MLTKKQVLDTARTSVTFINGMKMTSVAIEEIATAKETFSVTDGVIDGETDGHADNKGYHCSASFSISSSDEGVRKLMHSKVMQPEKNRAKRRKEMHEQLKKAQRFNKRLRLAKKQQYKTKTERDGSNY